MNSLNQLLETPSVIVNVAAMQSNIDRMAAVAKQNGVQLRPHVKTHKIPEIAKLQQNAGAVGITAAKLTEAEVMASNGIKDIFIAFPIVTDSKADRLCSLAAKGTRMIAGVDSLAGATVLSAAAGRQGVSIEVRLEIDTGFRRTGVIYENALDLAQEIAALPNLQLQGIYTYRGFFMKGKPTMELQEAGHEEGRLMVQLAARMREQGLPIKDVSVGSTPTGAYAAEIPGITEIRPGTYVFYDRMQARLGACTLDDCAAWIQATVVSRPAPDLVVIDGGSKTFATDVAVGAPPLNLAGYGHVIDFPHAVFERVSEEHGMIRVDPADAIQVGDTLKIIPNHICSTVNLHNRVWFQFPDGRLEERVVLARGGVY